MDGLSSIVLVAFTLWCLAPELGHHAITSWDESFHQAAARGTFDNFFYPHIFGDPLYPLDPANWWAPSVWLHKPVGPFWFAAIAMHLLGVTPLALRLASLLSQIAIPLVLFLLVRATAGRPAALAASAGYVALPFGWQLTQGYLFGDVTDCTLAAAVTVAIALLIWGIRKNSSSLLAASGAATGMAFLCKSALGLVPLGVAAVMALLVRFRLGSGPRTKALFAMIVSFLIIAAPWNLYARMKWPEWYSENVRITLEHVRHPPRPGVNMWDAPVDAVFNSLNATELAPISPALVLLIGGWLLARSIQRRDPLTVAVALWLWSTWTVHSLVQSKVPAQVWSAVPAVFVGYALLLADVWRFPALAMATVAAALSPLILQLVPSLGVFRGVVPDFLPLTRSSPGLFEGVLVALLAGTVTQAAFWSLRRGRWLAVVAGGIATAVLIWTTPISTRVQQARVADQHRERGRVTYTRELGLALDKAIPKRSVLFQTLDFDPPSAFEQYNSMFWSGRMTYRVAAPDLQTARAKGYHPYLVSSKAETFRAVDDVPSSAWLRAYDLEKPVNEPAPLPRGVLPLTAELGGLRILGIASTPADGARDRWAFFVHSDGIPAQLRIVFHGARGDREEQVLQPEASLYARQKLAGVAWFILPTLGPPRAEVTDLELVPGVHLKM